MTSCDLLLLCLLIARVFSNLLPSFAFLSRFLHLCCLCPCLTVLYTKDISVFRMLSTMCVILVR